MRDDLLVDLLSTTDAVEHADSSAESLTQLLAGVDGRVSSYEPASTVVLPVVIHGYSDGASVPSSTAATSTGIVHPISMEELRRIALTQQPVLITPTLSAAHISNAPDTSQAPSPASTASHSPARATVNITHEADSTGRSLDFNSEKDKENKTPKETKKEKKEKQTRCVKREGPVTRAAAERAKEESKRKLRRRG